MRLSKCISVVYSKLIVFNLLLQPSHSFMRPQSTIRKLIPFPKLILHWKLELGKCWNQGMDKFWNLFNLSMSKQITGFLFMVITFSLGWGMGNKSLQIFHVLLYHDAYKWDSVLCWRSLYVSRLKLVTTHYSFNVG